MKLKIFSNEIAANNFCDNVDHFKHEGDERYTGPVKKPGANEWAVEVLESDMENIPSPDNQGFLNELPADWHENEIE